MAQKAFNGHGLSDSHWATGIAIGRGKRALYRAGRNAGKGGNRKADFENQAKLMEYDANLKDWHNTRAPGHAAEMMRAQREAGTYTDDEGNVLGNISGSWKGAEGTSGSIGGWKNAKRAKEESEGTEENPHGQGQQMKRFAGPRNVFLGSEIPTLTSENSTTDSNGRISTIGNTRYNAGRRAFESNVDNRDAYQNQQDIQGQQADDFHNRGQQMSLF